MVFPLLPLSLSLSGESPWYLRDMEIEWKREKERERGERGGSSGR